MDIIDLIEVIHVRQMIAGTSNTSRPIQNELVKSIEFSLTIGNDDHVITIIFYCLLQVQHFLVGTALTLKFLCKYG